MIWSYLFIKLIKITSKYRYQFNHYKNSRYFWRCKFSKLVSFLTRLLGWAKLNQQYYISIIWFNHCFNVLIWCCRGNQPVSKDEIELSVGEGRVRGAGCHLEGFVETHDKGTKLRDILFFRLHELPQHLQRVVLGRG